MKGCQLYSKTCLLDCLFFFALWLGNLSWSIPLGFHLGRVARYGEYSLPVILDGLFHETPLHCGSQQFSRSGRHKHGTKNQWSVLLLLFCSCTMSLQGSFSWTDCTHHPQSPFMVSPGSAAIGTVHPKRQDCKWHDTAHGEPWRLHQKNYWNW